jgi:superfamily II DNA helicase RecQ
LCSNLLHNFSAPVRRPRRHVACVPDLDAALREHFAFDSFRPGQEEAVDAALAGRDVMMVMPTAGPPARSAPAGSGQATGPTC